MAISVTNTLEHVSLKHHLFNYNLLYLIASSNSFTDAKILSEKSNEPILVGGKKYITIPANDIASIIPTQLPEKEYVALSCRSLLIPSHGVKGTLYRTGEHVLIQNFSTSSAEVIRITAFFSISMHGITHAIVKGEHFPFEGSVHIYSSSQYVIPSSTIKYVISTNVLNKVMLYPDPENLLCPSKYVIN